MNKKTKILKLRRHFDVITAIYFFDTWQSIRNMLLTALDVWVFFIVFKIIISNLTKINLKHKKKFPFTVVDDLETTTGYISEVEGGPMFAIPYCLMFNFHPKLNMRPITCLRSLGQTEKELKFITIFGNFWQYINKTDYRCSWMHVTLFFKKNKNKQIWPSVWLRYGWFIKPWKNILMVLLK